MIVQLTIRQKIFSGFLAVMLLSASTLLIAYPSFGELKLLTSKTIPDSLLINILSTQSDLVSNFEKTLENYIIVQSSAARTDVMTQTSRIVFDFSRIRNICPEETNPIIKNIQDQQVKLENSIYPLIDQIDQGISTGQINRGTLAVFKLTDEIKNLYNQLRISKNAEMNNSMARKHKIITSLLYKLVAVQLTVIILGFSISIILSWAITSKFSKFSEFVREMAQGHFHFHASLKTSDELGMLAESFRKMALDLEQSTASVEELNSEIKERKKAERALLHAKERAERATKQLRNIQKVLVETSRKAGMAEVATDVLHNVGNVLNSVNVASTSIAERVNRLEVSNIQKIAKIISEHKDNFADFISSNPAGKMIPAYLEEAGKVLAKDQEDILKKLLSMEDSIDHIKKIVGMQQTYTRVGGVEVHTSIEEIVKDALQIDSSSLEGRDIKVHCTFADMGDISIDRQKMLQIIINLINNAKHALENSHGSVKEMRFCSSIFNGDRIKLEVSDNGIGIPRENLTKIFRHGFTTKEDGHGFGLHSCALAAKELGGSLKVSSPGPGKGAIFTLELPYKSVFAKT